MPPVSGTVCKCGSEDWRLNPEKTQPLKVIHHGRLLQEIVSGFLIIIIPPSSAGQLEFYRMGFECASCSEVKWQASEEFVSIGFWPTTVKQVPVADPCHICLCIMQDAFTRLFHFQVKTVIAEEVLEECRALQHKAPKVSRGAFLAAVASRNYILGVWW